MKKLLLIILSLNIAVLMFFTATVPAFADDVYIADNNSDWEYEIYDADGLPAESRSDARSGFLKPSNIIISLAVGALIGFIGVSIMKSKLFSVHKQFGASNYAVQGSMEVTYAEDIETDEQVTKIPKNSNNEQ